MRPARAQDRNVKLKGPGGQAGKWRACGRRGPGKHGRIVSRDTDDGKSGQVRAFPWSALGGRIRDMPCFHRVKRIPGMDDLLR